MTTNTGKTYVASSSIFPRWKKRFLSILMIAAMVVCTPLFAVSAAESNSGKTVTVSVEAFTIGNGYVVEPIRLDVKDGENGAHIFERAMNQMGLQYEFSGTADNGFYLKSVYGGNPPLVFADKIPDNLRQLLEKNGFSVHGTSSEKLGEYVFTSGAGWMYCVNNEFLPFGMSDYIPNDGDVMRVQFTMAWGADIGPSFLGDNFYDLANKDRLTAFVGEILASENKEALFEKEGVLSAYQTAIQTLGVIDASQQDIDTAYTALFEAVNRIPETTVSSTTSTSESTTSSTTTSETTAEEITTTTTVSGTTTSSSDTTISTSGTTTSSSDTTISTSDTTTTAAPSPETGVETPMILFALAGISVLILIFVYRKREKAEQK